MVIINTYINSFFIRCTKTGLILDSNDNTVVSIKKFLFYYLYIIDKPKNPYHKTTIDKYIYYNRTNENLYLPICYLDKFIKLLDYYNIPYQINNIPCIIPESIKIKIKPSLKDKPDQTDVINFIVNNENRMILIGLPTGFGKTYCSIKAITLLKYKSLIITPGHLQLQWKDELLKLTNIKEDDIYIIKGKKSILDLYDNHYRYKVYISTIDSLYRYITDISDEYYNLSELLSRMKIGIKIMDEVHLKFKQILTVDLLCNIRYNIYLTATFMRTQYKSNKIFQNYFIDKFKYNYTKKKKDINITHYDYNIGYIPEKKVMTPKGYSQIKYEKYLLKNIYKFNTLIKNIIFPVLETHYLDIRYPKEKCLILIALKEFGYNMCEAIDELLKENNYNEFKIGTYFSENTEEERDQLDIIISTIKSSGVGSNIKNLRTLILFDSFQAESWCLQVPGRLREIEHTPEFIYLQNINIKSHRYHGFKRKLIFRQLTNNFRHIFIN